MHTLDIVIRLRRGKSSHCRAGHPSMVSLPLWIGNISRADTRNISIYSVIDWQNFYIVFRFIAIQFKEKNLNKHCIAMYVASPPHSGCQRVCVW